MRVLYALAGYMMELGLRLASWRNAKARRLLSGRAETEQRLRERLDPSKRTIWFHAASLGEFEQGRPLIEAIGKAHPEYQVLVSFFSPSGYEVRHEYAGAACVVYLPSDTPGAVRRFLDLARPEMAVFVKYDFWPLMLTELRRRGVRTYLISAIFAERQLFFKPWGGWYRSLLHAFDYLWVQDTASVDLLARYGVHHAGVAGDTRFDRARAIAAGACEIPEVAMLRERMLYLVVAGSSWDEDERAIAHYINAHPEVGLVVAPHEIGEERLTYIESQITRPTARLSKVRAGDETPYECLIIDSFGLLAGLYRYADVAYIGGGFGKGIHNTVEAAVYGKPLVMGPRVEKFREAKLFAEHGAAFVAETESDVARYLGLLFTDEQVRRSASEASEAVVRSQLGATQIILEALGLGESTQ